MDINLIETLALCHFKQAVKVLNVAVNAAVGKKSYKVESCAVFLAVLASLSRAYS